MNLLNGLYRAAMQTRNTLYDRGVLRARRLRGPVVSVGNLSTGGAGKTPFVILLGSLLAKRGIAFDVLSRGYGRQTHGVALVDPAGSPQEFGDEPLLIARRLRVPVIVGESRYGAGRFAEAKFGPLLHLLDDGFQHRSLARDFDIALVSEDDARDRLLPTGRLREPLAALLRAHAVVLAEGVDASFLPANTPLLWRTRRGIDLVGVDLKKIAPTSPLHRPIAFCGIARPQRFFHDLDSAGIACALEIPFPDHHRYTEKDIQRLLRLKEEKNCSGFLTTEKDAINLGEQASALTPLAAIPARMDLLDADRALDTLLGSIGVGGKKRK